MILSTSEGVKGKLVMPSEVKEPQVHTDTISIYHRKPSSPVKTRRITFCLSEKMFYAKKLANRNLESFLRVGKK